ncbi:MAG: tetratricopeptide repeat protein, partial [Clostridia bacterium]
MTKRSLERGQVVPFARSTAYWHQRGLAQKRNQQPLDALELLRRAAQQDPHHEELLLDLAETYAEMHCYEQSNRILFQILAQHQCNPECYFGLGCNFFSLRIYPLARDCLMSYLRHAPDGEYTEDAEEMLALLEAQVLPKDGKTRLLRRTARAVAALEEGNPSMAVRLLRRVLALNPHDSATYALVAFALMAKGSAKEALKAARTAWRLDPTNLRACCAMAVALWQNEKPEAARRYVVYATQKVEEESDESLICQTACEIGAHDLAYAQLHGMEREQPYNPLLLHMLAVSCFYTGRMREALRHWACLRRIDPQDTVAAYYYDLLRTCLDAQRDPTAEMQPLYAIQLPPMACLERLKTLRNAVQDGTENLLRQWKEDPLLSQLVRWGLEQTEESIQRAMMGLLATVRDELAQTLLKEVLVEPSQGETLKRTAMLALYTQRVPGPYIAVLKQHLTWVHVDAVPEGRMLSSTHERLIQAVAKSLLP